MRQQGPWHDRGYIPHFDGEHVIQTITVRLVDSFPKVLQEHSQKMLDLFDQGHNLPLHEVQQAMEILDKGYGTCWLGIDEVARITQDALLYFHNLRYFVHAWVIMPNHVHAMYTPFEDETTGKLCKTWRTFSARESNKFLGRTGQFWARGIFDRYIRSRKHYDYALSYIEENPVKAGLCRTREAWPFSSASHLLIDGMWRAV